MRIIINADDLGYSKEVNDAIFEQMSKRQITSATIMANGGGLEDAAERCRQFPQCSFGVHMNLTEFKPVDPSPGLAPLLEGDSFGHDNLRRLKVDQPLRDAVFREWSAQIERIKSLGVPISHFDSHHHTHTVPGLFKVLKAVQKKFGVRKIRTTMNLYSASDPASMKLLLKKRAWDFALRHWGATTTATQGFTSFAIFREIAPRRRLGQENFELMTHPGHPLFEAETRSLGDPWQQGLTFPVQLISYNDL